MITVVIFRQLFKYISASFSFLISKFNFYFSGKAHPTIFCSSFIISHVCQILQSAASAVFVQSDKNGQKDAAASMVFSITDAAASSLLVLFTSRFRILLPLYTIRIRVNDC